MSQITTKIIVSEKDGAVVGEFFLQQGEHLIGRKANCSIKLKSDHVSREHACLTIGANTLEIEDLDSAWGTYLDDVQIKGRTPIQPTQKLRISDLSFDIERQSLVKMGPTKVEDLPMSVVIPGFILSELRTGFQMGFLLFIPFILVDFVVAIVLMSLGLLFLPPVTISMPLKILLFVLVDGWTLVVRSLALSFGV